MGPNESWYLVCFVEGKYDFTEVGPWWKVVSTGTMPAAERAAIMAKLDPDTNYTAYVNPISNTGTPYTYNMEVEHKWKVGR